MEEYIDAQTVNELKTAYKEMLQGGLEHPDLWEWYAIWMIELKDGTHIGDLSFKGLNADGSAEIGYGVFPQYEGCGYTTEAVAAAVNWAFSHPEVKRVTAEADENNIASHRVLEKNGFKPTGERGEEGLLFVLKNSIIRC